VDCSLAKQADMKLQILSDLHNEFLRSTQVMFSHHWKGDIPETDADLVILAGDIDVGINGIEWIIEESARLNKPIIYVLGNHEFYRHEYFSLKWEIASKAEGANIHFLDCGYLELDNVRILGLTLWTDYLADKTLPQDLAMFYAGNSLADHQLIQFKSSGSYRKFKPEDALLLHQTEKRWLVEQLETPFPGKTVVISHHAPHPVCIHPDYPNSPIGTAFYSDLEELIVKYDINLWIYGHTHSNLDVVIFDTRIVSNQAGYPGENIKNFNSRFVVEI
jgi:predicted phosphodiesterase